MLAKTTRHVLRYLWHLFTTPAAYLHNWRGFAVNQAGHGAVGIVLASFIGWPALALYALWEWAQYKASHGKSLWRWNGPMQVGATISDCLYDWCFVATGVLAVMYDAWPIIGLQGALIGAGVAERRGR